MADADVEVAVNGTAMGLFFKQGEVCAAGTRVLVHRSHYDAVVEALAGAAGAQVLGDRFDRRRRWASRPRNSPGASACASSGTNVDDTMPRQVSNPTVVTPDDADGLASGVDDTAIPTPPGPRARSRQPIERSVRSRNGRRSGQGSRGGEASEACSDPRDFRVVTSHNARAGSTASPAGGIFG